MKRKAFTLIEVILSVLILTIGLVSLFKLSSNSIKTITIVNDRFYLLTKANEYLNTTEQILSKKYKNIEVKKKIDNSKGLNKTTYTFTYNKEDFNITIYNFNIIK